MKAKSERENHNGKNQKLDYYCSKCGDIQTRQDAFFNGVCECVDLLRYRF